MVQIFVFKPSNASDCGCCLSFSCGSFCGLQENCFNGTTEGKNEYYNI